jgi:thiol-disulfide isomerase/thioredoxin
MNAVRLAAGLVAAGLTLSACSGGSNAVSQDGGSFRFVSGTHRGSVIPVPKRETLGAIKGDLLDGGTFALSQDLGKVTVVNFWATWCGPCTTETPQFDSVYRSYKSKDVAFVGIDTKEGGKSAPRAFVKDNDISYPIVFDEPGKIAVEMGNIPLGGLPATVLVDKQGKVAAVYVGILSPKDLEPVLDTLLTET